MNVRDSEFDQLLSEWLEDDAFVAPAGPVEAAVEFARIHPRRRDRLAFLRRDVMTTRATTGLRPVAMVIAVTLLLVAGIAGAVLVGSDPDSPPTPVPSGSESPSATPVAVQSLPVDSAPLAPGRYTGALIAPDENPVALPGPEGEVETPVDVAFTVDSGWSVSQPLGGATCCWYLTSEGRSISYWPLSNIYADACDVGIPMDPPIGPTVDDLVTGLDEQESTAMSEPIDVTIGGYPGVRFEMSPDNPVCTDVLVFWPSLGGDPGRGIDLNGGPGEDTQPVWIIDVDGHRLVFVAWTTGVNPADAEAVVEVMESMEFSVR